MIKKGCAALLLFGILSIFGYAQTWTSVPLDHPVYFILEQAESRGLCAPLPGTRPWTQYTVYSAIVEILSSEDAESGEAEGVTAVGGSEAESGDGVIGADPAPAKTKANPPRLPLSAAERAILEKFKREFGKREAGFSSERGAYHAESHIPKTDHVITGNLGGAVLLEGSVSALSNPRKFYYGEELWAKLYLNGDIGTHVSYDFTAGGGIMRAPRLKLGDKDNSATAYNTYYPGYTNTEKPGEFKNRQINTYSEPLSHFPFSYQKRWDGDVHEFSNLNTFKSWPESFAGAYNLYSEVSASFLENALFLRLGRLNHDWGSMPEGTSLALNQAARPFLGFELSFTPLTWLTFSSLTGGLEYYNTEGQKESSSTFQNAFSISMLELKYKNYISFDAGYSVVWVKRGELGYISPITNYFFYQNNIGDFDNMAMFFNVKGQKPGLGALWFSLFLDEVSLQKDMFKLDRTMMAGQVGLVIPVNPFPFSSLKFSFTKVNPYTYTHNRNFVPWASNVGGPMELSYTNNGVSLGYYIPPNSIEFLMQFKGMPKENLTAAVQYQLVIHGADYGPDAVDGSSLLSELAPNNRDGDPVLKRFFMFDGAYQWFHIAKLGIEYTLPTKPISFYGEFGVIYSYYTIAGDRPNTGARHNFRRIMSKEITNQDGTKQTIYTNRKQVIATFGIRFYR